MLIYSNILLSDKKSDMKYRVSILIFALAAFFSQTLVAQNSSTAVMEVSVEVVAGSSVNTISQSTPFDFDSSLGMDGQTYGEFQILLPEGVEVLASSDDYVTLSNGTEEWNMDSELNQEMSNEILNLRFTTPEKANGKKGHYQGIQVATIEYL